jgi:hypothetical protein
MRKILLPLVLFVIVIVLGFSIKKPTSPSSQEPYPSQTYDAIVESSKEYVPFSPEENAKVSVAYPVLSDSFLSALLKKQAFDRVEAFKAESLTYRYPDDTNEYTLETDYTREESTLYSTYVFSTYIYTGGAHGNQFRSTVTFDKAGKLVSLDTLFTDTQAALVAISAYAKEERSQTEFNTDMWLSGLDPSVDVYNRFIVRDDSLEFLFDPYEIAPYSSGLQKIIVPKSVYQEYLK